MKYLGIPIKKFFSGKCAPTNIYIHINDQKFIKVVNAGAEFDKTRLSNYENHEVRELFICESDLDCYINYCLELIKKILNTSGNIHGLDTFATCRFGEFIFLDLKLRGLHKSTAHNCLSMLGLIEKLILRKPSLNKLILEFIDIDEIIARHSLASAFFTTLLVQGMRWRSVKNVETIFLAALFQDVGLLNYGYLINKNASDFTEQERSNFEIHPEIGSQLILSCGLFDDYKIAYIIAQHHELPDGSGFPIGCGGKDIFPMTLPLIMTSRLSHLLLDQNSPLKERTFSSAIRYLKNREERFYPNTYWEGMQTWINVGLAD